MDFGQLFGTIILGKIFSPVYQKAAQTMCQECEDFIERGSKILDLGCGRGIVAGNLKNYFGAKIIGVDIKDQRVAKDFPFRVFDGQNLPFKENFFDACFISYVLHHAENLEELIKEAKRVSKDKIIIYEDLPEGISGRLGSFLHQATSKFIFSSENKNLNFKDEKSWQKFFESLKLKIIFKKRAKTWLNWLYPHKSVLFVLEKFDFSGA